MIGFIQKMSVFALISTIFAFSTGCAPQQQLPAGMTPEDVITKGFENAENIIKGVFEVSLRANLSGEENKLNGSLDIDGTFDEEAEIMLIKLNLDGQMDDQSVKGSFELRLNGDGVFLNIGSMQLSDQDAQEDIKEILADYMNQWVKLAFIQPDEIFEASEDNPFASVTKGEDFNPFTNIQFVGTQSILGLNSYHFTATLDEEKVIAQMKKEGTYEPEVDEAFEAMEFAGDVFVSVDGLVLTGIGGTATFSDPELRGTVDFDYMINPTRSDAVSTPSYEQEITEEDIGELLFGGGFVPGPIPTEGMMDETMMDEMMMDEAMMDEMMMDEASMKEFEDAMKDLENL